MAVFTAGACWLALLLYGVGALLRRAELTRATGETVHAFAFSLYALGTGITVLFLLTYMFDADLVDALSATGAVVGVPVLACSFLFFRRAQRRKREA